MAFLNHYAQQHEEEPTPKFIVSKKHAKTRPLLDEQEQELERSELESSLHRN